MSNVTQGMAGMGIAGQSNMMGELLLRHGFYQQELEQIVQN